MAVNVSLYKSLPYEPLTDFVPLALLAQTPFVLIVNAALPVKTIPELIAYAKANAGKMSFASVGPGVPHHLYMEMFKSMTGIQASHVPYRGSLPALNDVVAGHVPIIVTTTSDLVQMAKAGRIRVLATSDDKRSPFLPDVPTFREASYDLVATSWYGMFAPAKTPRDVIERYNSSPRVQRHPN